MTVKELKAVLAAFNDDQRVEIFDSAYGCIDITDMFSNEHHKSIVLSQRLTHYKASHTNNIRRALVMMGAT